MLSRKRKSVNRHLQISGERDELLGSRASTPASAIPPSALPADEDVRDPSGQFFFGAGLSGKHGENQKILTTENAEHTEENRNASGVFRLFRVFRG